MTTKQLDAIVATIRSVVADLTSLDLFDRIGACCVFGMVAGGAVSLGALLIELHPWLFAASFAVGFVWCWVAWGLE